MAVLVSQTCLQGRVGFRDRWVGGELFGVHWQQKKNQSAVGKEGHGRTARRERYPTEEYNALVADQGGYI